MKLSKVNFEKLRHCISQHFKCIADFEVAFDRDFYQQNIVAIFRSEILGKSKKFEFKYPMDWAEAFKERWFPKWLRKKYPVRYTVLMVDAQAVWEDFAMTLPDKMGKATFMVWENFKQEQE